MNRIYKYAKKSASKQDMSLKDRKELELQFIDHMVELYNDYKSEGYSEEESITKAINTFKETDCGDSDSSKKVNKLLYFLFGIYCIGFSLIYFYASTRADFFHTRININWLIPFKYTAFHLGEAIQNNNTSIEFLRGQLLFFSAFIPLGALIPIITSKQRSFFDNFIIYLYIAIGLQLIKIPLGFGIVCVDYMIIGLLGCTLGYGLLKISYGFIFKINEIKVIS